MREQREVASAKSVAPAETPRKEHLKLRVGNYMGREELDTAVMARRLVDPLAKVAFTMSCLGGRSRSWAYGRGLTDPTCFSTYESFKEELKPMDEATKVVTFMKGLRYGPVKTYLFREYPSTLAMQVEFSLKQA
ncbi:hypothetical protein PHMEG_00015618 [Phytophthora megakarya]|uniref:Uncharacterized protein n=1 Tax=Phytophthora megakarya TaxID=4795 RepID=A0A225W2D4_9STRA|nr:hypothetical protein PHMEG_00015618 [Phytophthora megakarya]